MPLAKPSVLVALVELAVEVWVMVGVPAVSRLQLIGKVPAPSAKVGPRQEELRLRYLPPGNCSPSSGGLNRSALRY